MEANVGPSVPTVNNPSIVNTMVMPWVMGVPWISKCSGEGSEIKIGEWLWQIEAMLRAQGLWKSKKPILLSGP